MFNLKFFKADPSTFVIRSVNGHVKSQGQGLSFWHNIATTSIAAPVKCAGNPVYFPISQTADFPEPSAFRATLLSGQCAGKTAWSA